MKSEEVIPGTSLSSLEIKNECEDSNSEDSTIYLGSPLLIREENIKPSQDIKGRRPIHASSRSLENSLEMEDECEANSTMCHDSYFLNNHKTIPSQNKEETKLKNPFFRFRGRTVGIVSLKRKATEEDSLEKEYRKKKRRKKFAGETASGTKKSLGFNFSLSLTISMPHATFTFCFQDNTGSE